MTIKYLFSSVFCILLVSGFAYADNLYKWVDGQGNVHYTNDPGTIPNKGVKEKKEFRFTDPPTKAIGSAKNIKGLTTEEVEEAAKIGLEKGDMPPDFTMSSIDGRSYKLGRQKGKVVFLNFWATWCGPCRREMPSMQKLYDTIGRRDFVMMAVTSEKKDHVKKFIKENGYRFPVLIDDRNISKKQYGVTSIPHTYILDKKGKIIYLHVGSVEWDTRKMIEWFRSLTTM